MKLAFLCPECATGIKVRDEFAGKSVRCPNCKAVVTAPAGRLKQPPAPAGTVQVSANRSSERRPQDEDEDDDRPAGSRSGKTDAPGVIGLVFGGLSLLCTVLTCCTAGFSGLVAVPLALVGAGCAFFAHGNMRIAGLIVNIFALIPALALT